MPRRDDWPDHPQVIRREDLARRLQEARERLKLSKTDVERQLGLGRSLLLTYENGRTPPPLQYLLELCALYGIAPGQILDPEPIRGEEDERIVSALQSQPGLRSLVLGMIDDRHMYDQIREWMSVVQALQRETGDLH